MPSCVRRDHWEEKTGTSAPWLQRVWLLATLAGNPDSRHAGDLACCCGILSYTGNWEPHSGTTVSTQPQTWTLHAGDPRGTTSTCPSSYYLLPYRGKCRHVMLHSCCFVLLFAQEWFPSIYPCDFLKIRYITLPSNNKVGTRTHLPLLFLAHSSNNQSPTTGIPTPVSVHSDTKYKHMAEH